MTNETKWDESNPRYQPSIDLGNLIGILSTILYDSDTGREEDSMNLFYCFFSQSFRYKYLTLSKTKISKLKQELDTWPYKFILDEEGKSTGDIDIESLLIKFVREAGGWVYIKGEPVRALNKAETPKAFWEILKSEVNKERDYVLDNEGSGLNKVIHDLRDLIDLETIDSEYKSEYGLEPGIEWGIYDLDDGNIKYELIGGTSHEND